MKKALVVVDYQNDFVDGALGFEDAEKIAGNIYALVEKAKEENDFIVFTKDTHYENYLETREGKFLPVPHCIKGSEGHGLFGKLAEYENDKDVTVVEKNTFGSVDLPEVLKNKFGGAPDVIEFCGVVTNICVISNVIICMSHFTDAEIIVHADATAALGDMQLHAIEVLKGLGVKVTE